MRILNIRKPEIFIYFWPLILNKYLKLHYSDFEHLTEDLLNV